MDTREFTRESKILLTDIDAGRNRTACGEKYVEMLSSAFSSYGIMKLVLNYFTRWEEMNDIPEAEGEQQAAESALMREAVECLIENSVKNSVKNPVKAPVKTETEGIDENSVRNSGNISERLAEVTEKVRAFRDRITEDMEYLTSFTDFFSLHEYILNRKEIALFGEPETVDTEQLADSLERFIFADQDKMVVNTRIQQVLEQLPVRMTKQRFYDILSETLALYKGGEISAAEDFLRSVRDVAGLTDRQDPEHRYPRLEEAKARLEAVEYKTVTKEQVEELQGLIHEVAAMIDEEVTDRMQLQEVLNDLLMVLLMKPYRKEEYLDDRYPDAENLLKQLVSGEETGSDTVSDSDSDSDSDEEVYSLAEEALPALEGAQEDIYESLLHLEMRLEDLAGAKIAEEAVLRDLRTADLLTSNSLFINLEQMLDLRNQDREMADEASIEKLKQNIFSAFDELFSGMDKERKRGIMAKVLGHVPVFFNTREEIRDYFRYTLEHCGDPGELTAVSRLLKMIMED